MLPNITTYWWHAFSAHYWQSCAFNVCSWNFYQAKPENCHHTEVIDFLSVDPIAIAKSVMRVSYMHALNNDEFAFAIDVAKEVNSKSEFMHCSSSVILFTLAIMYPEIKIIIIELINRNCVHIMLLVPSYSRKYMSAHGSFFGHWTHWAAILDIRQPHLAEKKREGWLLASIRT